MAKRKYAESGDIEYKALCEFWTKWPSLVAHDEKFALLQWIESVRDSWPTMKQQARRRHYWNRTRRKLPKLLPCGVCGVECYEIHYLVPIYRGGSNHERNRMRLCAACHGQVHPWLRKSSTLKQEKIYEKNKPIWEL